MSALQKQLASIASSATHELDLKAQRSAHSESLLFEPSVAANQSFDILYQICIEGFEELCALDTRFTKFRKSIFSAQSRTEDRTQLTAAENEGLDLVLQGFLGLVGARLLLRPALKALEWLVRRFRIHVYNAEYTVLTFLPHHATPLFTTLLSILPKRLPPSLKFLHPYMNSLGNPPRSVVAYTSVHNTGFFRCLNGYVLAVSKARYQHTALISLWASIVARTVDGRINASRSGRQNVQAQREEDFLVELLPILNDALNLHDASELVLGCYMVIVILTTKSDLDDHTLNALMVAVARSWTPDTTEAGLRCLAALAEQKENIELPQRVLKALSNLKRPAARLKTLSKHQVSQRLLLGLAKGCIDNAHTDGVRILRDLLDCDILDEESKMYILRAIQAKSSNKDRSDGEGLGALVQMQQMAFSIEKTSTTSIGKTLQVLDELQSSEPVSEDGSEKEQRNLAAFSAIPDQTSVQSFLAGESSNLFEQVWLVFGKTASSVPEGSKFFDLPLWQSNGSRNQLLVMTFLIRVWCLLRSGSVRRIALGLMIKGAEELITSSSAWQLVSVHALVALADNSPQVRRKAADLILALGDHGMRDRALRDPEVEQHTYGRPLSTSAYSNASASLLINSCIIPNLEECVADGSHMVSVFELIMRGVPISNRVAEKESGKRLKTAERDEIFTGILQHLQETAIMTVKHRLLLLMNTVDKINGRTRFSYMNGVLRQWLNTNGAEVEACKRDSLEVAELDKQHLEIVSAHDQDGLEFLLSIVRGDESVCRMALVKAAFERLHDLWPRMNESRQIGVFNALLRRAAVPRQDRNEEDIRIESRGFLGSVSVSSGLLSAVMQGLLQGVDQDTSSTPKRRRTNTGAIDTLGDNASISQETLVMLSLTLEVGDARQHPFSGPLFQTLFIVLRELQDFASRNSTDLGYLQSLTLSVLASQTRHLGEESKFPTVDTSIVRVDLLVDCIRNTSYMRARQSALLVLGPLAKAMPQTVLHNIIPVFTMMSTSTIQQSDDFSIYVVDQTVQEVIPLLAQALRTQNEDVVCATSDILLSFAAVFRHVPPERRIRLYGLLASSLGSKDVLHAIIATLVDSYPRDTEVLRFITSLMNQFSSIESINALYRYLDLIRCDSAAYKALVKRSQDKSQQKSTKSNLASVVPYLLTHGMGATKLQASYNDKGSAQGIRALFGLLIERTLRLYELDTRHNISRDLRNDILERALGLLPMDEYLETIDPLLDTEHEILTSILKVTELRVKSTKEAGAKLAKAGVKFLSHLTRILENIKDNSVKPNIVVCIDTLCERFGKFDNTAAFKAIEVVSLPCSPGSSSVLKSVSLHCIASSVEVLRNEFIPLLQPSLKAALDNVRDSLITKDRSVQLYCAAYAVAISVFDNLPYMVPEKTLSSFMELSAKSAASSLGSDANESRSQFWRAVATRLDIKLVYESVGKSWQFALTEGPSPLQEYIDLLHISVERNGKSAISKHARSLLEVYFTVFDLRRSTNSEAVSERFADPSRVHQLETRSIDSMIALVLKISDTAFRPFFVRLVEWATSSLPKHDTESQMLRSITLFRFSALLSERLRWLVTPYFTYILEPAASLLTTPLGQTASTKLSPQSASVYSSDVPMTLTASVLTAFISSFRQVMTAQQDLDSKAASSDPDFFKRDATEFYLSPARFQQLLPALLAPLSSPKYSKSKPSDRVQLVPQSSVILAQTLIAVTMLASTQRAQPAHLNQLTKSLLELCKDDDPKVRLNAVKTFRALTEGTQAVVATNYISRGPDEDIVGPTQAVSFEDREEWLGRELPAMLPVIAGLQEDDDEPVEKETGAWIRGMEKVLGQRLGELLE